uniref:uncharacterized abhydrolase domain-containing protein DDB_G0269086-like n=1 Tax=Bombus vancouverensis nearcticus TaxID=2705178 RepID=UPI001438AC1A|nr:uncharacterized abhydrolase domain-containing protein DDB_G0269086-like [Bombus vancouverensis nearcticus]
MPTCGIQCPLVKATLKKTITEAPWLSKKYFPSKDADLEEDVEFEDARDVGRLYKREVDGKVIDIVTGITKEDVSKVSIAKVQRKSETQWSVKGEDKVIVKEPIKDIEREDSAARLSERGRLERERPEREIAEREKLEHEKLERGKLELEKLERKKLELEKLEREKLELEKLEREKIKTPNGEPLRHDPIDEKELTIFPDECDPHCPRRISRSKYILLSTVLINVKC